jgi:DegV family protein with EDD domain
MGLGFAVLAAARAAAAGEPLGAVERIAVDIAARTRTFFSVPTLEYLRRGGRIGAAAALVGTALAIKPVLHVAGGRIVPLEKLRTSSRALARLVELAVQAAGDEPVSVAVHHLAAPQRAAELADRLRQRLPRLNGPVTCELGAVLGAHTGPGVLGVVVSPEG